jgi:hypothetical protein
LFFLSSRGGIRVVSLNDKGTPVFTALAEIHLTNISPDHRKDIAAFTDRTVQHIQQLYMSIWHKK